MRFFPASTLHQIEFDKIKELLSAHCRTEFAKNKSLQLRVHTKIEFIKLALQQSQEYKILLLSGQYFPNDFSLSVVKEIRLLSIPGASLTGEQFILIRRLTENTNGIFRWFDAEHRESNPGMANVIENVYYEKAIRSLIDDILDETGVVKDSASEELASIRMNLYRKRNELRRVFDKIVGKLNKQGYLADIEESFMNGRRVLAVFAEQKRMVKGVLHSESDSRRTTFIEPEETTGLNNDIFSLEYEENKEVYRILRLLTQQLSIYADLLGKYYDIVGEFDFIRAKAKLAMDTGGNYPRISDRAHVHLVNAYHPLLLLYNNENNKPTIPVNLTLDGFNSILVISGPNAGGKTVTLKTVGLLQVMIQSGLLVSVSPDSEMGIFKQLMIHIGDTQSLEFELSTYSAHLKNMKYFIENANGKTLFFIDELGSGSDPNLGGAFAEVIMEELARKHAFGIVTTHYLNLKVMANKVKGIINGAMQFDEKNLAPLYKLQIGQPGSSYTFSIAERIGLDKALIAKARALVDEGHFRLDKLLNRTEQDLQIVNQKQKELHYQIRENEKLKKEMEKVIDREKHEQQVELLKQQNRFSEERTVYLKDMERKLRTMVMEWKKTDDKEKVIREMSALLFKKNEQRAVNKKQEQLDLKYQELKGEIKIGDKVKMKKNFQVGEVLELRGKRAVVKIGLLPMQVELENLVLIKEKEN